MVASKLGVAVVCRWCDARVLASANTRRRNYKEKKKDAPSLAIGENYINKMFLSF